MRVLLLPLRPRFIIYTISIAGTVLFIGLTAWQASLIPILSVPMVIFAGLALLGTLDLMQTRHAVLRNYPISAHLRFLLEAIRPEMRRYFFEDEKHGLPFSRDKRAVVYQRAKNVLDERPFGRQYDVYTDGFEWLRHSIAPRPHATAPFRATGSRSARAGRSPQRSTSRAQSRSEPIGAMPRADSCSRWAASSRKAAIPTAVRPASLPRIPGDKRALVVPDKLQRVANFHASTMQSLVELTSAAGLDHPGEFALDHFSRRVSPSEVLTFRQLYPPLEPGELLRGTQNVRFAEAWKMQLSPVAGHGRGRDATAGLTLPLGTQGFKPRTMNASRDG